MSDERAVSDGASADLIGRSLTGEAKARKSWAAPKVIISSFASTGAKVGVAAIDTPRQGTGTVTTVPS